MKECSSGLVISLGRAPTVSTKTIGTSQGGAIDRWRSVGTALTETTHPGLDSV
jgi:hypothetical protein